MNDTVIIRNLADHVEAVRLCLASQLIVPTLVLIYSGIDFVASLGRPASKDDVTRRDFIDWVEKFMGCRERLGVNGIDLYAARCGVLHTYSPESRLHREGYSRRIFYCWGSREPDEANSLVQRLGYSEVFIKVETLFDAFLHGLYQFGEAAEKNKEIESLILGRGGKLFSDFSSFP